MRRLLPALVLLFAVPALAQVPEDLAEAYLEATHLAEPVGAVAEQLVSQISMQAGQFPEPARAPFLEIYQSAFAEGALAERLEAYVREAGDADSLRAVVAWYEQPLAQEMQALEREAAEDDNGQVAVQMYAMTGNFASTPVTPEREAQMDRYLAVTHADAAFVDLYLDIIVASSHSMRALATEEPPPADSIRTAMRPQLESQISGAIRGGTLYAYRDVEDASFDAYIDLLGHPAAHYANRFGPAAMKAALVGAITDAGESFAQRLLALDASGEIDLDAMRNPGGDEEPMDGETMEEDAMEDDGSDG